MITMEQRVANIRNGLSSSGEQDLAGMMQQQAPAEADDQSRFASFDDMQDMKRQRQDEALAREEAARAEARKLDIFNNALAERAAMSRYQSNVGTPTAGGSGFAPNGSAPVTVTSNKYNDITGKRGNKAYRNNNPGNITGMGGNLLYGAIGFAKSKHGDKGDQNQLVYDSPEAGTKAMYKLMSGSSYNNAPIGKAFDKWQSDKKAWSNMKNKYRQAGIDVDRQTFNDLTPNQKYTFMNIRAKHEGFQGDIPNIF